jgi:hypothetical protein
MNGTGKRIVAFLVEAKSVHTLTSELIETLGLFPDTAGGQQ